MDNYFHQIKDIHWDRAKDKFIPSIELIDLKDMSLKSFNLTGYNFDWELSSKTYCVGYDSKQGYVPCKHGRALFKPLTNQCFQCENDYGFKKAFFFKGEVNENIREHIYQPHYIYLAFFTPDILKVGTVAKSRTDIRLIEQDALVFAYIAEASDGLKAQELERYISKTFNITETVRSNHKLKYISQKPNYNIAKEKIISKFQQIKSQIVKESQYLSGQNVFDNIEIKDLSNIPELVYPENINIQKSVDKIKGKFVGLRGKYFMWEEDGQVCGVDERMVIGRKIKM